MIVPPGLALDTSQVGSHLPRGMDFAELKIENDRKHYQSLLINHGKRYWNRFPARAAGYA